MTESHDIAVLAADLEQLLGDKLGLRRGDLAARLSRAGRRLPKWLHRDGALIARAVMLGTHPKLMRQVDHAAVRAAHRRIAQHLGTIDPVDRRKGALLGLLGGLAFNLLVAGGLLVLLLKWRGLV